MIYGLSRVAGHVDFKDENRKITLNNVTEAIINTCKTHYQILNQYLLQAKNEKDFFERFIQIFQIILLTNTTILHAIREKKS